jgi:2,4-dienoyl-CoA reductase-like NADH-dependent reductase (Old Yellow Enzyme family)
MNVSSLLQPFRLKGLALKNRIVMAPMERAMSPDHVHTPEMAAYYRRRAEADVGLIISEATGIGRTASINHPGIPRFAGERELAAWKYTLEEVRRGGGKMAPQLWHVGAMPVPKHRIGRDWNMPVPFDSPSGFHKKDVKLSEPLTDSDIADILASYGESARNAHRLGFDAVEIHAAHGYLIDQFFWEDANARTDRYGGGTIGDRSRFAAEVVRAVRANVPDDFVVSIRLSQWKQQELTARLAPTIDEMEHWLGALADAGVDVFHCSQRRFWEPEFEGSDLNFAGWAKKLTGKATITVGSVGLSGDFINGVFRNEVATPASLDELVRRLEREDFDLVAVGRALLQDPCWFVKVRDGRYDELLTYTKETHAVLY